MEQSQWKELVPEQVNKYLAPQEHLTHLYHYTTMEALVNGIIGLSRKTGKELCLRATHAQYLNDPTELKNGKDCQRQIFTKIAEKIDTSTNGDTFSTQLDKVYNNSFFISFSENDDSLPMWSMYGGNGQGIALEFATPIETDCHSKWLVKCEYDATKMVERANEILSLDQKSGLLYIALFPFILKDAAYSYEKEYRFAGFIPDMPTHYRHKGGLAIPYKEIYFSKDILTGIIIGPAANQKRVEDSLRNFLNAAGMEHVNIKCSSVPYRTF